MRIELETVDAKVSAVSDIKEFCFTQTVNVACDSLWVSFYCDKALGEIKYVRAYDRDRLIFNGVCDCQKSIEDESGYEVYLYSRSTASILVDNEAEPYTYEKPSAKQLCFEIIEKYGFKSLLPNIYSDMKYEVVKGTSCYGAISRFVSLLTGDNTAITPNNEITLVKMSDNIKNLNAYSILSLTHTINRSEPYSQILFKKSSAEPRYNMHTEAQLGKKLGIDRKKYINLSSLPQWQRQNSVLQSLKESYEGYKTLEVKVSGYADDALLQRFSYKSKRSDYENYALTEKKYICDKYGEYTRLVLKKIVDIEEITYVD